jgi:hypothetical protein
MKTFGGAIPRPIPNRYRKKTNIIVNAEKKMANRKMRARKARKAAKKQRKNS